MKEADWCQELASILRGRTISWRTALSPNFSGFSLIVKISRLKDLSCSAPVSLFSSNYLLRTELKIAVDIDGVLADQVGAVLKVIENEYGLKYSRSDINRAHWCFEGREIWSEIGRLLADPEYVRNVPLIEGSQNAIRQLFLHDVFVVTARRPNAEVATKLWLSAHFPCLKQYYTAKTGHQAQYSFGCINRRPGHEYRGICKERS